MELWALRRGALVDRAVLARVLGRPAPDPRARFPAHMTLEEFDFIFQRSVKKQVIEHLGQLDFLHAKQNVIMLGPLDLVSHCLLSMAASDDDLRRRHSARTAGGKHRSDPAPATTAGPPRPPLPRCQSLPPRPQLAAAQAAAPIP